MYGMEKKFSTETRKFPSLGRVVILYRLFCKFLKFRKNSKIFKKQKVSSSEISES